MAKSSKADTANNVSNENSNIDLVETSQATPTATPEKIEPTRDELEARYDAAREKLSVAENAKPRNYVEIGKLTNDVQAAYKAINAFDAKIEAGKAALEAEQKRVASVAFIANAFGITVDALNAALDADKADTNQPLRNAIHTALGAKVVVAKDGQTGKNLTASANGEPKSSGKYAEMKTHFDAGMTKAQMVEMGYTDSDFNNATYKLKYIVNKETGGFKPNPKFA